MSWAAAACTTACSNSFQPSQISPGWLGEAKMWFPVFTGWFSGRSSWVWDFWYKHNLMSGCGHDFKTSKKVLKHGVSGSLTLQKSK